jgi:hypothetical protein
LAAVASVGKPIAATSVKSVRVRFMVLSFGCPEA